MELYKEILAKALEKEEVRVAFPHAAFNPVEFVALESYAALQKIKAIIEDDSLSDFDCIEKIVCVLEDLGSGGGIRHDFG